MPYEIKPLNDFPVPTVLARMSSPMDPIKDVPNYLNEIDATLAQIEGDLVYLITDPTEVDFNLGDIVQGLASALKPGDAVELAHVFDSRVRNLVIGTGMLMKLAVSSAQQDQYGNRQAELFATIDEALDHIRQAHAA